MFRVYLKTPNAPGQRIFSRCAAPFFLEIRQYSCEKMSCSAQKFLAAGHIGSFQIHPRNFGNPAKDSGIWIENRAVEVGSAARFPVRKRNDEEVCFGK